jgi:hypothetical protein
MFYKVPEAFCDIISHFQIIIPPEKKRIVPKGDSTIGSPITALQV